MTKPIQERLNLLKVVGAQLTNKTHFYCEKLVPHGSAAYEPIQEAEQCLQNTLQKHNGCSRHLAWMIVE